MAKLKLRGRDLRKIGFKDTAIIGLAMQQAHQYWKRYKRDEALDILRSLLENPEDFLDDPAMHPVAEMMMPSEEPRYEEISLNEQVLGYKTYGGKGIDTMAKQQMNTAMRLPIVKAGALMSDAHGGYGLPIGGVLATENKVIPYGVGVDIGCRMCLTVYPLETNYLKQHHKMLQTMLKANTKFGMKEVFDDPMTDLPIFERNAFKEIKLVRDLKDKAYKQMGSSGGGNHFVEFGEVTLEKGNDLGVKAGKYVGILSHSGSRGLGANIAQYYTRVAMDTCRLPKGAKNLAWLDLDSEAGQEYWLAMNLAGDYASACHHDIHRRLGLALGEQPLVMIENHHNFAWKEQLADGSEVVVHRKGATPAGKGVLGIIPGSMTAPGFIVRGKGSPLSINSASHGAGRLMSRTKAKGSFTKSYLKKYLKEKGVSVIGAGIDEAPMAYKDIHKVMSYQSNLVDVIGQFLPKIVRMADD